MPPNVVGRDVELGAAGWFLDAIPHGPAALVFRGEAGIGKTTLWQETLRAAGDRGWRVLCSQPALSEITLSFSALADILGGVCLEDFPSLPAPQRRGIEFALLRREPVGENADWRTTAAGLLSLLAEMSAVGPVVVAVDDAQWLDRPSARVLEFVARRLGDLRVGLLWSVRGSAEEAVSSALDRSLPADRRREVTVGPLSLPALHQVIGEQQGQFLGRPILARLHEASGGNPFCALEIVRAVTTRGLSIEPGLPLPVPGNVAALVGDRLGALPEEAAETVLAAAAMSEPTVAKLQAALGQRAASGLAVAEDHGVLELQHERVRFTHPLLSTVAYSRATGSVRRRMHRRLAETLADPEERAGHLARASTAPDAQVAAALGAAARMASARGAPDAAADYAEQARRFTPPSAEDDLRQRTVEAAGHHFDAGDLTRARALLETLDAGMAPGRARADVRWRLAKALRHERSYGEAAAVLTGALAESWDDPQLRAVLERELALDLVATGDVAAGQQHARTALSLTEETADPAAYDEALVTSAFIGFLGGQGFPEELVRRPWKAGVTGRREQVSRTPVVLVAGLLKWCDRLDDARVLFELAYRDTRERGLDTELPDLLWQLTELECWAGRWNQAERYAQEGLTVASLNGYRSGFAMGQYAAALVDAFRGRLDAARQQAQSSLAIAQETQSVMFTGCALSVLGFVELSAGSPAGVHGYLGPLVAFAATVGIAEPALVRFLPDEIEALIALDELDQAEGLLAPFEERAVALDRVWPLATAARCRALLLAARGELEAASETIVRAMAHHGRLPMPFELGRTFLVKGQIHRRMKQKRAAKESLDAALAIFDDLGAPPWADKARAELARVGLRPRASATLTATEERVAELVGAGLSNREVAEAAFLSPKTVEGVLTRVYRKLGVGSRAELGAWRARRSPQGSSQPS